MKKVLILTILFFTFFSTFAQKQVFKRKINWHKTKTISYYFDITQKGIDTRSYFSFDNSNYMENEQIPYYFELIPVKSKYTTVSVKNILYSELTNEEAKIIQDKSKITSELIVRQNIQKSRNNLFLEFNLFPLRKNPMSGKIEKIISFDILFTRDANTKKLLKSTKSFKAATESIFKNGNWVK